MAGFVGKPESAHKKNGHDFFFVNGRYMRHPYFHKAVVSAYDRLIPEGMQVPYFLYIDVNPAEVDVNIHPTKTEIKFENEQAIWQVLSATVRDAIGRFCEVPAIDFDTQGKPDIPVFDPVHDNIAAPKVNYNPNYNPFDRPAGSSSHAGRQSSVPSDWEQLYKGAAAPRKDDSSLFPMDEEHLQASAIDLSPLHYQYKGRYIMTAVKSGLMVIDQHRADVRIRYERYMQQLDHHSATSQQLLFPESVCCSPAEAVVLEKMLPSLTTIGFDLSPLGGNTFAINGIPAGIEGINPVSLLQQMVTEASGEDQLKALHATVALSLAQSVAIPYGQVLNNDEMEQLVNELFACDNVNYTPSGKAILGIMPQTDIERLLDGKG